MTKSLKLLIVHFAVLLVLFFLLPLVLKSHFASPGFFQTITLLLILPAVSFIMTFLMSKLGANWLLASIAALICFIPAAFFVFGIKAAYPYMLGYLLSSGIGGNLGNSWRKKAQLKREASITTDKLPPQYQNIHTATKTDSAAPAADGNITN